MMSWHMTRWLAQDVSEEPWNALLKLTEGKNEQRGQKEPSPKAKPGNSSDKAEGSNQIARTYDKGRL